MSSKTKRQDLPKNASGTRETAASSAHVSEAGLWPGLWVVATPIGNLLDLTERARRALALANAVLCEDTRRTSRLMAALGISARLERFDAHSRPGELERWVERLLQGENLAVVTDAGTPGISDPAAALVNAAREAGVRVVPVPGASAVTALLSVSGVLDPAFVFRGFFPRKAGERAQELAAIEAAQEVSRVFVWYESPERVVSALECLASHPALANSRLVVAKELTKLHERIFTATPEEVLGQVREEVEREGALGEWCLILEILSAKPAAAGSSAQGTGLDSAASKALQCLVNLGVSASDAAREVSQSFGVPKKAAYEAFLRLSRKK